MLIMTGRQYQSCRDVQVAERLAALDEACRQLQAVAEGKPVTGKLTRSLARLDKTESLAWLDTPSGSQPLHDAGLMPASQPAQVAWAAFAESA